MIVKTLAISLILVSTGVASAQERLMVSRPIARTIGANDTHRYVVVLSTGDRASVSIVQDGALEAVIIAPDGHEIRREAPADADGEKDFQIAGDAPGAYRIEVRPVARKHATYEIELDGVSSASERSSPRRATTAEEQQARTPTPDDLTLLKRADELLASASRWDRHDTRICLPTATTLSLYCALQKASLDLFGEYRHRAIALEEVRFAIEDVTDGREFSHRLKDFNNLATTTFRDVKTVLTISIHRIRRRLDRRP